MEDPLKHSAGSRDVAMSILIGIAARKSIDEKSPVKIKELTDLTPSHKDHKIKQACKPGSVLYGNKHKESVIYLGPESLPGSNSLPPGIGRTTLNRRYIWPFNP